MNFVADDCLFQIKSVDTWIAFSVAGGWFLELPER
jgi:hypothetical protein